MTDVLSAWVYENTVPDWAKADRYGITEVDIDPRSGNAASLIKANPTGKTTGCYFAFSWFPNLTGTQFARWVSDTLNKVAPKIGTAEAPPCVLDLEQIPPELVTEIVVEYRKRQPRRPTRYTNAPGQNQTVVPVDVLKAANMPWDVQTYYDDMRPVEDPAGVILEVCRIYDPLMVNPFYGWKNYPAVRPYDVKGGSVFVLDNLA